ncbi:septation protein A [Cohaesibacter celericrescens]|jgi:intracellular septation protein|uniref:Inner membrane-spanning protein YciB n=1 Tax=Cohaesibacter celericrescens TaxID=2067669 RepID=A0A2N5XP79_9HYPH|nr:septation protein A [Cohaesibacter celericrescens]PLW76336.1 septation protein A [Cohaesibacter celericrescens]
MSNSNIPTGQTPEPKAEQGQLMKLVLELGPLAVFFFANAKGDLVASWLPFLSDMEPIFIATACFMVATILSLAVSRIKFGKLPIMPMISGVVVFIFGGLTLYLQDDTFIKMKPTIVNLLFGSILLVGLLFGKSLLGYVFDSVFQLNAEGWRILTFRWGVFFFFLAIVNEVVWRNFSTDMWVNFKVFGVMPITMIFGMLQMPLLTKHGLEQD